VQAGILAFQQEWGRYRSLAPSGAGISDERAHPQLRKMINRFTVSPTTEEATLFGGWLHDDNYGSKDTETIASAAMASSLRYMTPRQLLELPMTKLYWPMGLTALYDETLAVAAAAIADGTLPFDALDPSQPCEVHISVDNGGGFREVLVRPAGPNGNGLSFLAVEIGGRPIRAVMLRVAEGPGILRIDGLRLAFSVQGLPEPVPVSLDSPEDLAQLRFQGCVSLSDNVLLGSSQAPELVYQCLPEWTSGVYKVEIEMRFAWMALSPFRGAPAGKGQVLAQVAERGLQRLKKVWHMSAREANERFRPRS
jgi:hypothetical protein